MKVTTNVKIVSQSPTQSGMTGRGWMMALCSALSFLLLGIARRRFDARFSLAAVVLLVAATMTGCSGSGHTNAPIQEMGTKTILINATCGTVTKSAPLIVTIQ